MPLDISGRISCPFIILQATTMAMMTPQNRTTTTKYIDMQDIDGRTALHHAVLARNEEIILVLLQYGADASIRDSNGRTAHDLAVLQELSSNMIALLQY